MSDIEYNAVNACRSLVRWWQAIPASLRRRLTAGDTALDPVCVREARQVVAAYDAEIQRYREPSKAGDFSPRAESRRGWSAGEQMARDANGEIQG